MYHVWTNSLFPLPESNLLEFDARRDRLEQSAHIGLERHRLKRPTRGRGQHMSVLRGSGDVLEGRMGEIIAREDLEGAQSARFEVADDRGTSPSPADVNH